MADEIGWSVVADRRVNQDRGFRDFLQQFATVFVVDELRVCSLVCTSNFSELLWMAEMSSLSWRTLTTASRSGRCLEKEFNSAVFLYTEPCSRSSVHQIII